MSTTMTHELKYPGATPEQVYAMLSTADFREQVCDYQGFPRRNVSITPAGAGMEVEVDQYRPADEVPSFAKKFVGAEINIVQKESWSSPTAATLSVGIPGKPGEMAGTVTIAADGADTVETVSVTIKVGIPLVGGKIEGFLVQMLTRALRAENKVGRKWLEAH